MKIKNRKYLHKLITVIILGVFIPVIVSLSFFMESSFKELESSNEMHYEELLTSFTDSFYLKFMELKHHADSLSAYSKNTESAFWLGNENFKENVYWYFEAVTELNTEYTHGCTELFGVYYYETDSVLFPEGKRTAHDFVRYMGVEDLDAQVWNYFSKDNYRRGEVVLGTTNSGHKSDGYLLVGYCTTMGKNYDEVLIFYCIEPDEYKDTLGYVYDSTGIDFYVLDQTGEEVYLALGDASKSSVEFAELETERKVAGVIQKIIYREEMRYFPLSMAMYVTDDFLQNDIIMFYRLMWTILWGIVVVLVLVCVFVLYVAYKPVHKLASEVDEYDGDEFERISSALHSRRARILEQEMLIMDLLLKHLIQGVHISKKKIASLGVDASFQYFCVFVLDGHTLLSSEVKLLTGEIEKKYAVRFFATDWQGENRSILILFLKEPATKNIMESLNGWFKTHLLEDYSFYVGQVVNELDDIRSSFVSCLNQKKKDENPETDRQNINKEIMSLDYKDEKQKKMLEEILAYLEAHYRDVDIGQTLVADTFKMSSYTLSRIFKSQVGVGFAEYINSKRVEYAKELLLTTSYSVRDISAMAGFSSDAYFCRIFKATVGITPAAFREQ